MKPTAFSTTLAAVPQRTPWVVVRQNECVISNQTSRGSFCWLAVHSYSANVVKVGGCLLAMVFLVIGIVSEAVACGMPLSLSGGSGSAFVGSRDYRFRLSDVWGTIRLSSKETMEIGALFSPINNLYLSRVLGVNWSLPVIEATFLPTSGDTYEMIFPTGHREILRKTNTSNQLKGGNWLAAINGKTVTAKSSCGWTAVYVAGRLKMLKTPMGAQVEFNHNTQGASWITVNGTSVLTLKPDFGVDTQKIYHLNLQGGRHAVLRFGTRPVLVATREKDSFGRPQERKMDALSLTSIQWDGAAERKYDFGLNGLNVAGQMYMWDPQNINLLQEGKKGYSFQSVRGIRCLKTRHADGSISLRGENNKGVFISQLPGGAIEIVESVRDSGGYGFKPRKIFILQNGKEELIRQHWYDENGVERKLFVKNSENSVYYERIGNSFIATDASTGKILWKKFYNAQGNLIEFQDDKKTYKFADDRTKNDCVTITQISSKGIQEKTLPKSIFDTFVKRL